MNRQDLLDFHNRICSDARALMERKNHDYTGKGGESPFANFTRTEALGVCTTEQGFLVRMSDKLSRMASFVHSGEFKVSDESVRDTLIDLINYSVLLAGWLEEKASAKPADDPVDGDDDPSGLGYLAPGDLISIRDAIYTVTSRSRYGDVVSATCDGFPGSDRRFCFSRERLAHLGAKRAGRIPPTNSTGSQP